MKSIASILFIFLFLSNICLSQHADNRIFSNFKIFQSHNQIHVLKGAEHFTSYVFDTTLLKPILYPIYSPSGIMVQREYPLKVVDGESHDHPHHAGLFFTYGTEGEVNGNNFWASQKGLSKIRHKLLKEMKSEPGKAMLKTVANWIGEDGSEVLQEHRTMTFSGDAHKNIIDFDIELRAGKESVTFKDTKEGMLGIRVADWLTEKLGSGLYLNSEGDTAEKNVWGKAAKWVRLAGQQNDQTVGLVIMHHPSRVNYPTYWHARAYGLFAANPLGRLAFQQGRGLENPQPLNYQIPAGDSAFFKFRIIIYEGDVGVDEIEANFEQYKSVQHSKRTD